MLLCPFHPFFRKSDLLLVDSAVLEFQILKQKKNSGSTFSSCVSFHYKRSDSLFQTVSSPVFLSGSRYSVGLFNIPYTIFTMCLATQINAGAYSCLPPAFSGSMTVLHAYNIMMKISMLIPSISISTFIFI